MSALTRRQVLTTGVLGVAGVAVAGCSAGDSTPQGASTTSPGSSKPTGPAAAGEALVAAADVPLEGGVIIASGQTKVVVTQPQPDQYVGLSAVCPHQGCLVNQVTNQKIICPCHGSQFSITDGAVIQGPAQTGLPAVPVQLVGDQIVLG